MGKCYRCGATGRVTVCVRCANELAGAASDIRAATIAECLEVATREHSEAQREGLGCQAAWECAREGLRDLLKSEGRKKQ